MNIYWLHNNLGNQSTYSLYKRAKHSYNCLIRNTKSNFRRDLIEKSTNKNRTVWNLVNTITNRKDSKLKSIKIVVNGVSYDEPRVVADIFANHFTTIAKTSLNRYYKGTLSSSCTTSCITNVNFFFYPIVEHEVIQF